MTNKEYEKLLKLKEAEIQLLREINKMLEIQVDYWRIMVEGCQKFNPWIPSDVYEEPSKWVGEKPPYIPEYDDLYGTAKPYKYGGYPIWPTCQNQ